VRWPPGIIAAAGDSACVVAAQLLCSAPTHLLSRRPRCTQWDPSLDADGAVEWARVRLDAHCVTDITRVLVQTQQHTHTHRATCVKSSGAARDTCRFNFPRPPCDATTVRTMTDDATGELFVRVELARHPLAAYINPYSRLLVEHARNHDLRLVFADCSRSVEYATKYVSKPPKALENAHEAMSASFALRLAQEQLRAAAANGKAPASNAALATGVGRVMSLVTRLSSLQEVASPLAAL